MSEIQHLTERPKMWQ